MQRMGSFLFWFVFGLLPVLKHLGHCQGTGCRGAVNEGLGAQQEAEADDVGAAPLAVVQSEGSSSDDEDHCNAADARVPRNAQGAVLMPAGWWQQAGYLGGD